MTLSPRMLMMGFKPVSLCDWVYFQGYFQSYIKRRSHSRFFMSSAWMAAHVNEYLWGVRMGCLVIVKRKKVHQYYGLLLALPPIHPEGDTEAEREVLDEFLAAGFDARLSDADLDDMSLSQDKSTGRAIVSGEYLYRAGSICPPPSGRKSKNWRNISNRLDAAVSRGDVRVDEWKTGIPFDRIGSCLDLLSRWMRSATKPGGTSAMKRLIKMRPQENDGVSAVLVSDDKARILQVMHRVSYEHVMILLRIAVTEGSASVTEGGRTAHVIASRKVSKESGPGTMVNMGAAGFSGTLRSHKQILRPSMIVGVHNYGSSVGIDRDLWLDTSPGELIERDDSAQERFSFGI